MNCARWQLQLPQWPRNPFHRTNTTAPPKKSSRTPGREDKKRRGPKPPEEFLLKDERYLGCVKTTATFNGLQPLRLPLPHAKDEFLQIGMLLISR